MISRQKALSMSPVRQPPSLPGQLAPGPPVPTQGRRRSVRSRTSRISTVSGPHNKMLLYPGDKRPLDPVANLQAVVAAAVAANAEAAKNGTDKTSMTVSLDTRSTVISEDGQSNTLQFPEASVINQENLVNLSADSNIASKSAVPGGENGDAIVCASPQGDVQTKSDKKPTDSNPDDKTATSTAATTTTPAKKPTEKMRHVSEIVLNKLRTTKKSGNLAIEFDPKKLEIPPNKTYGEPESPNPINPPPAVVISQDQGKPGITGLTRTKTILRSERGGSGSGRSQGSGGSQNQVPVPISRGQRVYRPVDAGMVAAQGGGAIVSGDLQDDMSFYEEIYYLDDEDEDVVDDVGKRPVPIILSTLLVVVYIIGGAFLFQDWEGWSLLDSSYFCFITLTTIGFGDFVPDHKHAEDGETRLVLCSIYMLFGIAMLAMSFNLVQEEVINSVKTIGRMLGILQDDEDEEDY